MDRDQIEAELADVNAQLDALIAERRQNPGAFSETKVELFLTLNMRQEDLQQTLWALSTAHGMHLPD